MAKHNMFSLEITTTALCNLGCSYCFEGVKTDTTRLDDKVELVKQRIREFYHSDFFKDNYEVLSLSFWGGEPTLNSDFIVDIINEFSGYENVAFHIYTNGYNRKRLERVIENIDYSRLTVQVSYDGQSINDKFRLTHSGKPTSAQVIENFEYLARKGVTVSLKATLPLNSMKGLYSAWQDYKRLYDKFNEIGPNVSISYSPTIDYVEGIPAERLPELISSFRSEMLKIAKEEITFYKEHGHHLCRWFGAEDEKVHCASGAHMHAINVDGKTYACHGSFYSSEKDLQQGSDIHFDTFVTDVEKMARTYQEPIKEVSDVCKGCVATTCMICPVVSLESSKKENYFDRWTDRWVNNMCGFFKAFGEIDRTVQAHLDNQLPERQLKEIN